MKSVRAAPLLVHEKVTELGVNSVARQPRVTMSPVPEPHGARGNSVGARGVAKEGKSRHVINISKQNLMST